MPFFHEGLFAAAVAEAGTGNLVIQRTTNAYGHCNFTVQETVKALTDLAAWAETGVRPAN